jgi:hypothetical protein
MVLLLFILVSIPLAFISQRRMKLIPLCEPDFLYISRDDSFRPPFVRA